MRSTDAGALAQLVGDGAYFAPVVDEHARPVGVITTDVIHAMARSAAAVAPQHAAAPAPAGYPMGRLAR